MKKMMSNVQGLTARMVYMKLLKTMRQHSLNKQNFVWFLSNWKIVVIMITHIDQSFQELGFGKGRAYEQEEDEEEEDERT